MIFEPVRPSVPDTSVSEPAGNPEANADFVSRHQWSAERPSALVIACSDGRMRAHLDDFLNNHLGINAYDRLYVPGGPGGLAGGAAEFSRAAQMVSECQFLVKSHGTSEVILIFHGAAPDGPDEAVCADYSRKHSDRARVPQMQDTDLKELLRTAFSGPDAPKVRAFNANVTAAGKVLFTRLDCGR
ncbi:MAG TPA: hypothetical protein VGM51_19210 [Armatimonadota bacterium]|jgi:hypothetical protein